MLVFRHLAKWRFRGWAVAAFRLEIGARRVSIGQSRGWLVFFYASAEWRWLWLAAGIEDCQERITLVNPHMHLPSDFCFIVSAVQALFKPICLIWALTTQFLDREAFWGLRMDHSLNEASKVNELLFRHLLPSLRLIYFISEHLNHIFWVWRQFRILFSKTAFKEIWSCQHIDQNYTQSKGIHFAQIRLF